MKSNLLSSKRNKKMFVKCRSLKNNDFFIYLCSLKSTLNNFTNNKCKTFFLLYNYCNSIRENNILHLIRIYLKRNKMCYGLYSDF